MTLSWKQCLREFLYRIHNSFFSCLKSIIQDIEWREVLKHVMEMSMTLFGGDYLISNCTILPPLHLCMCWWRKGWLVTLEGTSWCLNKRENSSNRYLCSTSCMTLKQALLQGWSPWHIAGNDQRGEKRWQSGILVWESPFIALIYSLGKSWVRGGCFYLKDTFYVVFWEDSMWSWMNPTYHFKCGLLSHSAVTCSANLFR